MSIYEPVEKLLDEAIRDFKDEFQRANSTVGELCVLEPYEMNGLLKSNARARAAMTVKTLIKDADEQAHSTVVRQVENLTNEAIKMGSYSVGRFYERVIHTLKQSSSL